jgi:hypothetical protein
VVNLAGQLSIEGFVPRPCVQRILCGRVSLDNNGGFIQMAADIDPPPPGMTGLMLDVSGNGEEYNVHLRTSDLDRPWQSYRASFVASENRQEIRFPLEDFTPHRTDAPFNAANIRRIGIVAIGREFDADVWVYSIAWY